MYTITVGPENGDLIGSNNHVIQSAIDRLAALGGGRVKLWPGTYTINDSIHLRSNIILEGSGKSTVLWKPPSVHSETINFLGYGHYDVSVKEPEKFHLGQGVYIREEQPAGFFDTVATINSINGSELGLTRMLNKDVHERNGGCVISVYPLVSGTNLRGAQIKQLMIDGNKDENQYMNGCRGGGIFLLQAHDVTVENVVVESFNGDGISFQQCLNTTVNRCTCSNNSGHGLHPGSGSVGAIIKETHASNNGIDGIFYCLRVSFSSCIDCTITGNGRAGICIGHRDEDLLIHGNAITTNGVQGIYYRKDPYDLTGHRTVIRNNEINNNCRREGQGEILIDTRVRDVYIYGNSDLTPEDVRVRCTQYLHGVTFEEPAEGLLVGPRSYPSAACRHLTRMPGVFYRD